MRAPYLIRVEASRRKMRIPTISPHSFYFLVALPFLVCVVLVTQLRCSLPPHPRSLPMLRDELNDADTNVTMRVDTKHAYRAALDSHDQELHMRLPPIFTLHFAQDSDAYGVEHNCVLAAEASASMAVITDNPKYGYCAVCRCIPFNPTHCPAPTRYGNNCEKLALVQRLLGEVGEFVYLDSDLVVMKPRFFRMLAPRTGAHDFVAPLAEGAYLQRARHRNFFNSGLMFIRALPAANHSDLVPRMYRLATGSDQSIITYHVRDYYDNYDNLSLQWHCRRILRYNIDIHPKYCITVHDRNEIWTILKMLNMQLRKAESLRAPGS